MIVRDNHTEFSPKRFVYRTLIRSLDECNLKDSTVEIPSKFKIFVSHGCSVVEIPLFRLETIVLVQIWGYTKVLKLSHLFRIDKSGREGCGG